MKISTAMGLAPQVNAPRSLAGSPTGSFASMIASGHSVGSIRSERAFGFSETGLFGAARTLQQENGQAHAPAKGIAPSDVGSKSSQGELGFGNRTKSEVPALPAKMTESRARTLSVVINRTRASGTSACIGPHRSENVSIARYAPNTKHRVDVRHFTINTVRLFEQRKRQLTVTGPGDALCVTINSVDADSIEENSLLLTFFSTALQYGMTLASMKLSNSDRVSFDNFRIWRR